MNLDFLKGFDKDIEKIDGITTSAEPPRYWYSTGNYALNKVMSGDFMKGIPQGRITDIAGPSGAGKSYLAGNLVKTAQTNGAFCVIIDSENAFTDDFTSAIGIDPKNNYKYFSVSTIPQVIRIVSSLLKNYNDSAKRGIKNPPVFVLIDSLDMLITETELDHFSKGDTKGDQGQKNKQLKAMLRTFVQGIKNLDITLVCTSQVYKNQDLKNGEGLWIVSDAVKYSCSQILLVQKRKLRAGEESGEVLGVKIIAEGYKTRFTKPFQKVDVEVPYETGMDPNSGLKEAAVAAGVLVRSGSRYYIEGGTGETFYWKDVDDHIDELLEALSKSDAAIDVTEVFETEIDTSTETKADTKARRKAKVGADDEAPELG